MDGKLLLVLAALVSLPLLLLLPALLLRRASPDHVLVRRHRLVAGVGLAVWGALLVVGFLRGERAIWMLAGSMLGMVVCMFMWEVRGRAAEESTSSPRR